MQSPNARFETGNSERDTLRRRAVVLDPATALEQVGDVWQDLLIKAENSTCFMSPQSFRAWHRTLSAGVNSSVIAVFEDDELIGVLPILRSRVWRGPSCIPRIDYAPFDRDLIPARWRRPVPVRQISSLVSWRATSVRSTLLCRDGDLSKTTDAVATILSAQPGWDVIVLPAQEGEESRSWQRSFRTIGLNPKVHRLGRTILTLEEVLPFAELVAATGKKNFRQRIRRAWATACDAGTAFEIYVGKSNVEQRLNIIAQVAASSWKHKGRPKDPIAISYEGSQRRFFEELITSSDRGLTPVLVTASAKGEPIGVLLCFWHAATLSTLLLFRKESDDRCHGLLLLAHLIDWAAQHDIKRLDFNGTQDWLKYVTNQRRTVENIVVFAPTLLGSALSILSRIALRVRGNPGVDS
jgi:hypothetical protein